MTINQTNTDFHPASHDRPLLEQDIDAYHAKEKLPEPAACPQCGAIFHKGHWQWGAVPNDVHRKICPACHRINNQSPAGFVTLEGDFLLTHHEDIIHLIRNQEQHQRAEHPLKRIMAIEQQKDSVLVTTTDIHLARGIGEALRHAYQGELDLKYNADEHLLRVHWSR
ncbi:MAG: BCAM0308 family protein [Betaproteobacteria bacterium]